MFEWIQHWDEMRFYYWSPFNWVILVPVYLGGAAVIAFICWLLVKLWKPAWLLSIPLFLVLAVAPFWEELGIAYNFGQLCKKDAGIVIHKTVEVEGFYDASAGAIRVLDPVPQQTADHWDNRGYRFYEQSLSDTRGGPSHVVHYEKGDGVWKGVVLDQPTARYHYETVASHLPVSHEIRKFEDIVVDQETGEVLGRYLNYRRGAPWYFVHLDVPTIECKEIRDDTRKYGSVIHRAVLKPAN